MEAQQSSLASRILLRLDNGSLIGDSARLRSDEASGGTMLLPVDQALSSGRLHEADVSRMEKILSTVYGLAAQAAFSPDYDRAAHTASGVSWLICC